jgi:hypothetical protein
MNKLNFLMLLFLSCSHLNARFEELPTYKRKNWPHWSDMDKDCFNTRHEILSERSIVEVKFSRKKCKVDQGKWADYYYPQFHTDPKKVDIDHLVPLKHAHETGGALWVKKEKEKFANDPENLVITDKKFNRKKGALRIDQWLPVHKDYACKYVRDWIKVKTKYQLKITGPERKTIQTLSCP